MSAVQSQQNKAVSLFFIWATGGSLAKSAGGARTDRVGFGVWSNMPIGDAMACVKEAEKQGFESTWVVESSLTPGKDAVSYLGALAVSTKHIRLATGAINIFSRSATLIASTMATLDEMSKGRMILGIGTGHDVVTGYHSIRFQDPLNRILEYVEVFRQLVRGGTVNYKGNYIQIENLKLNLQPYREKIPVYVATVGRRLARIAGEVADGVLFVLTSPSRVGELTESVREGARDAGRAMDDVDVACYLPTFAMEDTETALRVARQTVAGYARSKFYRRLYAKMGYGKEAQQLAEAWAKAGMQEAVSTVPERMARELVLVGTLDECKRRLAEYRRLGVKLPVIQPYYTLGDLNSNVRRCIERFAP